MAIETCEHANPDNARYCSTCGAPRATRCPACQQANPVGSRYCNQCGGALRDTATAVADAAGAADLGSAAAGAPAADGRAAAPVEPAEDASAAAPAAPSGDASPASAQPAGAAGSPAEPAHVIHHRHGGGWSRHVLRRRGFDLQPGKYTYLLAWLAVRYLLQPVLAFDDLSRFLLDAALILPLLALFWSLHERPAWRRAVLALTILLLVVDALSYRLDDFALSLALVLVMIAFMALVTLAILGNVLGGGHVTADRIFGALVAYLLIGFTWGFLLALVELVQPGSFALQNIKPGVYGAEFHATELDDLIYLSFVTLTSVGYGDIVATHNTGRTLLWLEAVLGQIYPAVLVGRLVALQITHSGADRQHP